MYVMLEHPDITNALRTGYPSWMQDDEYRDEDDQEGCDEDALYEEKRDAANGW